MSSVKETIYETDHHEPATVNSTLTTFAVLAVLAVVSMYVGFSMSGPWKVLYSLIVATVQAVILSLYFMDMRRADRLTWLCAGAAIFWTGLLFLFTMTDYLTRHYAAF